MERESIACLCIDIHDYNEELKLEYASIGSEALIIAKERLDFNSQINSLKNIFKLLDNKEAKDLILEFQNIVTTILSFLRIEGLNVGKIHSLYQEKVDKLETSVNLLFDKISEQDHEPDIFDDDVVEPQFQVDNNIELAEIRGRNRKYLLPPLENKPIIINKPKLSRWKQWRQKRKSETKKPSVSKKGYYVFE